MFACVKCDGTWFCLLPDPLRSQRDQKRSHGADFQFSCRVFIPCRTSGWGGWICRLPSSLPSAFLLCPLSLPLVLASDSSSFFLFPTLNSHKAPNKPTANIKTVQLFPKDDQGKVSSLKRHLYLLSH